MFLLDAAVLLGVLLILTKVGDLVLRPHQQARVQALVEAATLKLSYMSTITVARRLARHRLWRLALLLAVLIPVQMYLVLPFVGAMLARDPRNTPEFVGLVVVVLFVSQCLATVPAALALQWVLRDDSGRRTALRYASLLALLVAVNAVATWIVTNDPTPQSGIGGRLSGLVMLAAGSITADLFIAAWVFAFALLGYVLLRTLEAVAWRVAEYQRGAWAAVVALATALLAAVDLYLKR